MLALALLVSVARGGPADDLDALERLITAVHPAPYRYTPEAVVHDAFARERAVIDGASELEVGRAFHRVLALLGDAHVYVALPMMQPDATTAVSALPLLPRTVEGRVLLDSSGFDVPPGAEVLAIDGLPVAEVYGTLLDLVAADGRDPDAALRLLEHDLPRYHALEYGMSETYEARLRLPDGSEVTQQAHGVDRQGMSALRRARHVAAWWGGDGGLPVLVRSDGRAVLRVPTMGVADTEAFRAAVDGAMAEVAPDEPLVIDVRGNLGGLRPNAFAILDHLLGEPYVGWTQMRVARVRVPRALRKGLAWPYGTDRERLVPAFTRGQDGWHVAGDPLAGLSRPRGTHPGPVTVLVDGRTGSAANGFVLVLERYRPDVVVVGEPLGGACDRHVGELPVVWTGRDTGVVVMFSLIDATHVEVPGCVPGRGLAPDIRVAPTARDFLEQVDPWLAVTE